MQRAKIQSKNQKWNPFSLWFVILIFYDLYFNFLPFSLISGKGDNA